MNRILFILLAACVPNLVKAQTFLDHVQEKNDKGVVTIYQSSAIADKVNGVGGGASASGTPTVKPYQVVTPKPVATTTGTSAQQNDNTDYTLPKDAKKAKARGYRIQLYAGNSSRESRSQAMNMGAKLKSIFPEMSVYTHFNNPRWICRAGDFLSLEDARVKLREIKKLNDFKEATIVKSAIVVHVVETGINQ